MSPADRPLADLAPADLAPADVSVRGVFVTYGRRPILERVSLDVSAGAFCSIVGASGCGKSTFLRLLLGQERPARGEIRVGDAPPAREPGPDRGVVFQRYSVFPHLSVRDNVVLAGELRSRAWFGRLVGPARRRLREQADALLVSVGLDHVATAWPAELSGGMQQRLAIAQALAARPRVLLLDEPFGALDPGTRTAMHTLITELWRDTGMTIFMVSHDLTEAFTLGTRVIVFDKPRWDPQDPSAYGATVTYDFKLDDDKRWETLGHDAPASLAFGPPDAAAAGDGVAAHDGERAGAAAAPS